MNRHHLLFVSTLLLQTGSASSFGVSLPATRRTVLPKFASEDGENTSEESQSESKEKQQSATPDPSDLTDRFKWKVNALMGVFDPQGDDDDRQQGNIMNALLNFPVKYSFNVVGRTGGDDATVQQFVEQVKQIVIKETGDQDGIQCQIIPRSKNFTKLTIQANVENANMISAAYDGIEALELTVMRF